MPLITTLPHEIILEITRFAAFRDSIALLITCKVLHDIYKARPFWIDQVLRLKQRFKPLLPDHISSLTIEDLKRTAWNPYRFETAVLQQKVQLSHCGCLKTSTRSNYWGAKVVPGGQWLFTLSVEVDANDTNEVPRRHSLIRVWCITRAIPTCVASLELRSDFTPLVLCLQPGDSALGLLVFVYSFRKEPRSVYLQALRINMADENPQLLPVAELESDRSCSGISVQGRNVIMTFSHQGGEEDALIWDWRNDEKDFIRSPEPAGRYWFMTASKTIATFWDLETLSIEVHLPSPLGGDAKVGSHRPVSAASNTHDGIDYAIVPTPIDPWILGTDLHQIALAHLKQETLRIDMEDLGAGRIGFTSYPKDNTYMQGDTLRPFGNTYEVPADVFKTVSDHLVDLSSSGRLTLYPSPEDRGEETECIVYKTKVDGMDLVGQQLPFICPFSGTVGSVSTGGILSIWRPEQDACV